MCGRFPARQRGTDETTNGLLRQYFPKSNDLSMYSETDLDTVTDELIGHLLLSAA